MQPCADLVKQLLRDDELRAARPFMAEFAEAQEVVLASEGEAREKAIGDWLNTRQQPCLFGRIAVSKGLLTYCVLDEKRLSESDEEIRGYIQERRRAWRKAARTGTTSGFVIAAVSQRLAWSAPDERLLALARRLASLYLLTDVKTDAIYHEDLYLDVPGPAEMHTYQWRAGVNFFGAAGDGRWWKDHRFPGGIALSVNSVGHMVKSALRASALGGLSKAMQLAGEPNVVELPKLESLGDALGLAMRTIDAASKPGLGRCTWLVKAGPNGTCPVRLPPDVAAFDHRTYRGMYHTDVTIPSSYFDGSVDRPNQDDLTLEFDYLLEDGSDVLDFFTMGEGVQIQRDSAEPPSGGEMNRRVSAKGRLLTIEEAELARRVIEG